MHLSANVTGGTPASYDYAGRMIPYYVNPGEINSYTLADTYSWEGGRGRRCDFWQEMGAKIPA